MRTLDDLVQIRFQLHSTISLDWERIELDPDWIMISSEFDLSDQEQLEQALFRYIASYISRQQILTHMPSTNGPGDLYVLNMEIVNGSNAGTDETVSGSSTSRIHSENNG
jgi:hypothetical protein